jgi:hypothetical protein
MWSIAELQKLLNDSGASLVQSSGSPAAARVWFLLARPLTNGSVEPSPIDGQWSHVQRVSSPVTESKQPRGTCRVSGARYYITAGSALTVR